MISAQTRSASVARENRFPLFRIMLFPDHALKERFQARRIPLRVKKTRQDKNLIASVLIGSGPKRSAAGTLT
jgi:hypothetical protein